MIETYLPLGAVKAVAAACTGLGFIGGAWLGSAIRRHRDLRKMKIRADAMQRIRQRM